MAITPQNVTRTMPRHIPAPPAFAPIAPSSARNAMDAPATTGTRCAKGATNTMASGSGVTYPRWHNVPFEGLYSQIIGQSGAARVRRQYSMYSSSDGDHRYAQVFNAAASGYARVRHYKTGAELAQSFQDTAGTVGTSHSSFQWSLGATPGGGEPAAIHISHMVTYVDEISSGNVPTIVALLVAI